MTRDQKLRAEIAGNVIDLLIGYRSDLIEAGLSPAREEQLVNAAIGGLHFLLGLAEGRREHQD